MHDAGGKDRECNGERLETRFRRLGPAAGHAAALRRRPRIRRYRLEFEPSPLLPEELTLSLGPVDDESQIWLNGKFLGK
ncbi:MAG: hypothetical protein V8T86_18800 [Victivallis sp.]